jgi:DNA modification methylase
MELYNNDCLEVMKDLSANSIDLLFCDLPYGQTSCKWDTKIDLELFWKQVNKICKINCPMFFTTTTRFGVDLINSNPKNFRYDLVWVKTQSCGFLNAKKMPMRKHEMIYVFYRKLPLYNLSSHSHKFLGNFNTDSKAENCYSNYQPLELKKYDPPLPNSVIKEDGFEYKVSANEIIYGPNLYLKQYKGRKNGEPAYDPPLPNSVIKEEKCYGEGSHDYEYKGEARESNVYDPPLPVSVIQVKGKYKVSTNEVVYRPDLPLKQYQGKDKQGPVFDPPLPNSILEIKSQKGKHSTQKPTELMKWILKYYSKEGDIVLDPTMGSGSTGLACKEMNRKFIGIEKDEKIYKSAVERLN